MIENDIVIKARNFAIMKHKGQKDDDGLDYFENHIAKVVKLLSIITKDKSILATAYLHDTIEDTNTKYSLLKQVFGEDIAKLVHEVTHEGKKDNYGYYFPRLHSKEGIMIKFADRLSNISRMDSWDRERKAQYLKKSKFWKDKI